MKINRNLKNILYLVVLLLIVALIGYVIFSYSQFNGAAISIDFLKGNVYFTYDGTGMFEIGEDGSVSFLYTDLDLKFQKAEYSENVFQVLQGEETLYFYVIDDGKTIYNDKFRIYLHEEVTEE